MNLIKIYFDLNENFGISNGFFIGRVVSRLR